jgi:hypothetical protein
MGSSRQQSTSINPHAGHTVVCAQKSNAAFYLGKAKAAKKDLASLGKGLAYNVSVVDRAGGTPRIDDPIAAAFQAPLKLLPFGGNAPDCSGAQGRFITRRARRSTSQILCFVMSGINKH